MKNNVLVLLIIILFSGCGVANYSRYDEYNVVSIETVENLSILRVNKEGFNEKTLYVMDIDSLQVNSKIKIKTYLIPYLY